jgi:hypothetical protein
MYHEKVGLEHISKPTNRVLAKTLDKIILNFGREVAIRDYINPILESKQASKEFLEYLEVLKTFLISGVY